MVYDVVIVGGSYAGISAGMQLARGRRTVLVIDAGQRRNRFAEHSHGFLGQDGRNPGDIADEARAQLLAYPTVEWLQQSAVKAGQCGEGFAVVTADEQCFEARRLIIASGMVDVLPDIPGLSERWGKHVFHCPYCHGYELNGGPIGVLAATPIAMHQALMLADWGPTTLFLNEVFEPDAEQLASLKKRGVTLEREPVVSINGHADITMASGRVVELAGLFTQPHMHMASPLPVQLGCEFEAGPMGDFIKVNATRETSVPGVFACGDAAVAAAIGRESRAMWRRLCRGDG